MEYEIKTVASAGEIDRAQYLEISRFRWLSGYSPKSRAAVVYLKGRGFVIRMESFEQEPKAVYTHDNDPVCRDSCLECFINFAPDRSGAYINLEANAVAALHCKFGSGRENRKPLQELCTVQPSVKAEIFQDSWRVDFFVPLACISQLYGVEDFSPGDVIRANFYKCGDETACPHYGMWAQIDSPKPDFHRPEFFGRLLIRE